MKKSSQIILALAFVSLIWPVGVAQAQSEQDLSAEISFWESVRDSDRPEELQAYLDAFPDGKFSPLAVLRLEALVGVPDPNRQDRSGEAGEAEQVETVEAASVEENAEERLRYCLAATEGARRGPFAAVADPALALKLCDQAEVSSNTTDRLEIHESKALIHLSTYDYDAVLREASALLDDKPSRGQGLSCVAQIFLETIDNERQGHCASAAAQGDIFGIYGVSLLQDAAERTQSGLPKALDDALATATGDARQDLMRLVGLLLADGQLRPVEVPEDLLAGLPGGSSADVRTDGNSAAPDLPADLRIRSMLLFREGNDGDRAEALFLLRDAASLGDREAMMLLGRLALEEANTLSRLSGDLREEAIIRADEGASWLQRLVTVGPHEGAYFAIFSHFYGIGAERDLSRAGKLIDLVKGRDAPARRQSAGELLEEATGDRNARPNVVYLQLALARLGYDAGSADGLLGAKTEKAIAAFASDRGLASDLDVAEVIGLLVQRERWQAARARNLELESAPQGHVLWDPDPLTFGWDAAYAF